MKLAIMLIVIILAGCRAAVREPIYYSRNDLPSCLRYTWVGPLGMNAAEALIAVNGVKITDCIKSLKD